MNKLITRFAFGGILVMVLFSVVLISGCAKEKPCKAIITVLDVNNLPVAGAQIHLVAPAPSTVDITTTTDASGKANFEVSLPQILDINVNYNSNSYGSGKVVRFEPGKTDEVTVNLP
ncbi:MAG: Ig-like domain-containing protein [Bacteroidota bacterium]|nr:Ig-like domain-containing protein [Bacteroidota bacterium]